MQYKYAPLAKQLAGLSSGYGELASSVPGTLDDITPVIVVDPVWKMRYGAVVVVGLEVVPVQETDRGLAVVLPVAGMNVTTLVVVAPKVPDPDIITGLLSLALQALSSWLSIRPAAGEVLLLDGAILFCACLPGGRYAS
jgi:hypothetical protein